MAGFCRYGRAHEWRQSGDGWYCGTCGIARHRGVEVGGFHRITCPHPGHRERAYDVATSPSVFLGLDFIRVNGEPYGDFKVEFWRCAECGRSAPHPERGHFIVDLPLPLVAA